VASTNPFQREINRRIDEYSATVRLVAQEENVGYLAAYEAMLARIMDEPVRAFKCFRFYSLYGDDFRALVLRKRPDGGLSRCPRWP